ncbi:MAG: hypothetical protein R3B96_14630 [Pirellulaceae bacterium]
MKSNCCGELEQAEAELVWQRATIREHSLTHPERGVDAMLVCFRAISDRTLGME